MLRGFAERALVALGWLGRGLAVPQPMMYDFGEDTEAMARKRRARAEERLEKKVSDTVDKYRRRHGFVVPDGYEAVRDAEGRATGEVRPIRAAAIEDLMRFADPQKEAALNALYLARDRLNRAIEVLENR